MIFLHFILLAEGFFSSILLGWDANSAGPQEIPVSITLQIPLKRKKYFLYALSTFVYIYIFFEKYY